MVYFAAKRICGRGADHDVTTPALLSKTPLHEAHVRLRAKLVPFAGWEMPVQYGGIIAEHRAVRSAWGIFDVSHMGRVRLWGADAGRLLHRLMTSDVPALAEWRARYGLMCLENGGILDDVVALRQEAGRWYLVCNASNREAVLKHLAGERARLVGHADTSLEDETTATVMIAAQGPMAIEGASAVLGASFGALKRFGGGLFRWKGVPALVTRTGYTGEDGIEIVVAASQGVALWEALLQAGAMPCGLGARDTLRLEAGLPLHGNDISLERNPIEAGLERYVRSDEGFIGARAIHEAQRRGVSQRLAGFRAVQKGVAPRHGHSLFHEGRAVGVVTSGSPSPTLEANIGMGYVTRELAKPGTRLTVDVRGTKVAVEIVPLPFYKRIA